MYTPGQYSKEYGTRDGSSRPQEDGKEANSVVKKFIVMFFIVSLGVQYMMRAALFLHPQDSVLLAIPYCN